jgi:mono/diheme cytochrome c family protein
VKKILIVIIISLLVLTGLSLYAAEATKVDAKALFEKKCSQCHSADRPKSKKKTAAEWESTVARMQKNGCPVTDEEAKIIVDYLANTYGK